MICGFRSRLASCAPLCNVRKLLAWLGGADATAMAVFALQAPWLIAFLAALVVRSAASTGVTIYIHPVEEGSDEFMQGDNPSDTTTNAG
jgi:Flp pilus assembly protein protease CpaA